MTNLLQLIQRQLTVAIPAMLLLGFGLGMVIEADPLRVLIIPLTVLMVYPMMVTLKVRQLASGLGGRTQWLTQAINFGLIPFLAFALGLVFFRDAPFLALGLLLAGLVPTSGMTISWTGMSGGNVPAAIKLTVVGLILGALATPVYVDWLLGTALDVDFWLVLRQILLIVFVPLLAGLATQHWLIGRYGQQAFQQKLGPRFPPLSTLGVLGIVFVAMALNARTIWSEPGLLLLVIPPLLILYGVNFALSTLVARRTLPRGDGIALVYGTVMRNLSIAMAVAMNAFGPEGTQAALVLAVAYIVQAQAAAWYARYSSVIFGPKDSKTS